MKTYLFFLLAVLVVPLWYSCQEGPDVLAPTIEFLSPSQNGSYPIEDTLAIRVDLSDNENLLQYKITVKSVYNNRIPNFEKSDTISGTMVRLEEQFPLSLASELEMFIIVEARDQAGNKNNNSRRILIEP